MAQSAQGHFDTKNHFSFDFSTNFRCNNSSVLIYPSILQFCAITMKASFLNEHLLIKASVDVLFLESRVSINTESNSSL